MYLHLVSEINNINKALYLVQTEAREDFEMFTFGQKLDGLKEIWEICSSISNYLKELLIIFFTLCQNIFKTECITLFFK